MQILRIYKEEALRIRLISQFVALPRKAALRIRRLLLNPMRDRWAGEETEEGRQIAGAIEEDGIPYYLLLITCSLFLY